MNMTRKQWLAANREAAAEILAAPEKHGDFAHEFALRFINLHGETSK
jgi:hypothetical protein